MKSLIKKKAMERAKKVDPEASEPKAIEEKEAIEDIEAPAEPPVSLAGKKKPVKKKNPKEPNFY